MIYANGFNCVISNHLNLMQWMICLLISIDFWGFQQSPAHPWPTSQRPLGQMWSNRALNMLDLYWLWMTVVSMYALLGFFPGRWNPAPPKGLDGSQLPCANLNLCHRALPPNLSDVLRWFKTFHWKQIHSCVTTSADRPLQCRQGPAQPGVQGQ